jgi:hypothetical protein
VVDTAILVLLQELGNWALFTEGMEQLDLGIAEIDKNSVNTMLR